jgi:hypothetical protein
MRIINSLVELGRRHPRRPAIALTAVTVVAAAGVLVTAGMAGGEYSYKVTASPDLKVRSGPGTSYPVGSGSATARHWTSRARPGPAASCTIATSGTASAPATCRITG